MGHTIAEQLVRYLEARGVEHIFGLCGHTNIAVLAALSKSKKIKFINSRHEQIAAHAADGYARATRKASVLLSHLSPGLTNAATGVANAALDSIPMVVIAGDVPSHYYGKHPHQEVNLHADASQFEIYRPFVKRAWRVDSAHLFPEIIEKAFVLGRAAVPARCWSTCRWTSSRWKSKRASTACWPTHAHCQAVARRADRREDRQAAAGREEAAAVRRRWHPARRRGHRDARVRRAPAASGSAYADGQGRAARRSPADPRHDRLLGHQVHQRQVPQRRLDPGAGHALSEADCSSWRTSTRSASRRHS